MSNLSPDPSPDKSNARDAAVASCGATSVPASSLARRWANWASNLLVSGVIVVVGLVFGREVVQWWRTPSSGDSSNSAAATPGPSDADPLNGSVQELSFGELPYAFRHGSVGGEVAQVVVELRRQCALSAEMAVQPEGPPAPAERRMLEGLGAFQPTDRRAGAWQIYVLDRPVPMAVAVSDRHDADSPSVDIRPPREADRRNAVAGSRRVLSWAMAFPDMDEKAWTWFTFRPSGAATGSGEVGASDSDWPAPPNARRSLVIRAEDGAARTAYSGSGTRAAWQSHFDQCASRLGWTSREEWVTGDQTARRSFANKQGAQIEVQIGEEPARKMQAIVTRKPR